MVDASGPPRGQHGSTRSALALVSLILIASYNFTVVNIYKGTGRLYLNVLAEGAREELLSTLWFNLLGGAAVGLVLLARWLWIQKSSRDH